METSKVNHHTKAMNKRSMPLRHRNILQSRSRSRSRSRSTLSKKKNKATTMTTFCVVFVALCASPEPSHALIARGRLVSHRMNIGTNTHKRSSKVTRTTSLQYQDYYQSNDDVNMNRCQMNVEHADQIETQHTHHMTNSIDSEQRQHHQQPQQQSQEQQQPTKQPIRAESTSTASHRSNNNHDHQISNIFHTLWTSGKSRRARELHALQAQLQEERQKQYVLDDYLESIDRRYKRLHDKDQDDRSRAGSKSTKGFTSALQWLKQGSSESLSELEEQRRQEDAIYVLGLADLASTSLLQRHHLPIPKSKMNKSVVIDIDLKPVSQSETVPAPQVKVDQSQSQNPTSVMKMSKVSPALILQVLRMLNFNEHFAHIQKAMTSCSKQAKDLNILFHKGTRLCGKTLVQAMASLISWVGATSGGKQSFQIASMILTTVFAFVLSTFRPFTKA
eukprot:CAMPEP_0203654982 /NCGR_PEP_ID=MMETSP0088-20131115/36833_1 /ASSEMBLY_ACC=CAM_ASM_001087 /TAXON_ID=426623 /ORGANISM="Chaetoceros affinis, Strain CCMP159" /LENGTH=446 /DNA_ID=CAMNT_0050515445 /DNA_START=129 /DNA_END=1469 /DNA_ORIENTATION=-